MIFKGKKKAEADVEALKEEQFLSRFREVEVPILILDERWHHIFPDNKKSASVRELEEALRESFKRQARISEELEKEENTKQKLMKRIINNMRVAQISEKEAEKQDKSQQLIKEINGKIAELEAEYEEIPQKIKALNEELLIESMRVCYRIMEANKVQLDKQKALVEEAQQLLLERTLVKQNLEKENQQMYTFMHRMFGRKILELFDEFDDEVERDEQP